MLDKLIKQHKKGKHNRGLTEENTQLGKISPIGYFKFPIGDSVPFLHLVAELAARVMIFGDAPHMRGAGPVVLVRLTRHVGVVFDDTAGCGALTCGLPSF